MFSPSQLLHFWGAFLRPHFRVLVPLVFLNMVPGILLSTRPLVLAPVLGKVLPSDTGPASSLGNVTLDNLGATLQAVIGNPADNLMHAFLISGLLYFVMTLFASITGAVATLWSMSIRLRILKAMTIALHKHLLSLDLSYFQRHRTGGFLSRFSVDLTKTAASLEVIFSGTVKPVIQMVVYSAILFRSDQWLTMQVLMVGSLHLAITYGLGGMVRRLTTRTYDVLAHLTAALQETFQNIRIIKSFSAEGFDAKKITREAENVREKSYKFYFAKYLEDPIRLLADGVVMVGILFISYNAIAENKMTLAGITLFFYMTSQLVIPVTELSRNILNIYSVSGGFVRLGEMFGTKPQIIDGHMVVNDFKDNIVLDNISFSFDNKQILKNISLTIKKGESIGIVGPSGGGKSTLIDLILRLIDPMEGKILFDGVDIKEYEQEAYRKSFGIVSQECLLFNATVRDNITIGRKLVDEDLKRACRIANLESFIASLPDGLDTLVGDRGVLISGGQRQRITMARAVYAHPSILVLDEATSSLDTISEKKVQVAMNRAIEGVTAIIVAHRLSTIMHADKILVINKGQIEAFGTHQELLLNCPLYNGLYEN